MDHLRLVYDIWAASSDYLLRFADSHVHSHGQILQYKKFKTTTNNELSQKWMLVLDSRSPSAEKKDSLSEPPFGGANRLILSWAMRGIKKLDGVGSSREKCQILQPTLASFSWASTSQELLSRPSAVLYGALQSLEDPKYRLRRHT